MQLLRLRTVGVLLATLTLLVAGCGDDDGSSDASEDTVVDDGSLDGDAEDAATDDTTDTDDTGADDTDDDGGTAAPPAEDSGTVTVGGETAELGSADFLICETVNPAFDENVNIVVELPFDPGELRVAGDLPDAVNLEFGEIANRIIVEGIDVTRDGRTLSGSAVVEGTPVEFSFTC